MSHLWSDVLMSGAVGRGLGDHLWQSTLGVGIAALLVWLAGPGRPAVRHAIWLLASLKFLVPVAAIIAAGEMLAPVLAALPVRDLPTAGFGVVVEPFTLWAEAGSRAAAVDSPASVAPLLPALVISIWAIGAIALLATRWTRWRDVRAMVSGSPVLSAGREVDALRRNLASWDRRGGRVVLREIAGASAPALFGIRRAALLWPTGLSGRLRDHEIDAVVAHEVAHFRRRDNLAALLHTLVETVCWFHPLVWWMGARLVEERERACDQEALAAGVPPQAYAGTLLNVCRFGLALPQPLIASAAGSSLARRVEVIMAYRPGRLLARPRGTAAALVFLLLCWPMAVGVSRAHARGAVEPPAAGIAAPHQDPPTPWHPAVQRGHGIRALHSEQVTYTPEARRAGVEGTVELEALIVPDGTVGDVRLVKSLDRTFGLDEQAIKTARLWRFAPPIDREGRPVQAVVTLILDFRLPQAQPPALVPEAGRRGVFVGSPVGQAPVSPAAPPRDPKPAAPDQADLEFREGAVAPGTPGLTPAKPIRQVQPRYTAEAMRGKVQGSVGIEIVVGPDGVVDRARVVGGFLTGSREELIDGINQQALEAARQWRFEPATLDGSPVAMWMRLTMDFKLY